MTTSSLNPNWKYLSAEARGWVQDNFTASPWLMVANLALAWLAWAVWQSQVEAAPTLTNVVGGVWLALLAVVVVSTAARRENAVSEWLKARLFSSSLNALITLIISVLVVNVVRRVLDWAWFSANFDTDPKLAAASEHTGATWGTIYANFKLFMVGQFDPEQLWRVWASVAVVVVLAAISVPVYGPLSVQLKRYRRWMTWAWLVSPLVLWVLLRGVGESGPVALIETRTWGGLLFTLIIAVFAIVVSFPLGVLLALGRRSTLTGIPAWLTYLAGGAAGLWGLVNYTLPNWALANGWLEYALILWPVWVFIGLVALQRAFKGNVVAAFSTLYIEFVRGVPLITVLFMANIMLPLFLPPEIEIENAFSAMWGFALFSAAYLAETVRGGLQSIPKGQYEAAQALGLNTFQELRHIILPQALRVVIPPLAGQFIGLYKDTSLVAIVGLFDLLNIANSVIAQPDWLGLRRETYVFISVVYYVGCFLMAGVGTWLEKRVGLGER